VRRADEDLLFASVIKTGFYIRKKAACRTLAPEKRMIGVPVWELFALYRRNLFLNGGAEGVRAAAGERRKCAEH
jgi:hypothetical protein